MKQPPPKQKRSRETEQRLLSVAQDLIAERGLAGLSIAELVRMAGSSVGSFYGRFGDKDGLLRALHARRFEDILSTLDTMGQTGAIEGLDLETATLMCMTEIVRHYKEHAPLMAAFSARAAVDPEGWSETIESHVRLVQMLAGLLASAQGTTDHPQPEKAFELGLHVVFSFLGDLAVYGRLDAAFSPFDHDALPDELSRMLLGYWRPAGS